MATPMATAAAAAKFTTPNFMMVFLSESGRDGRSVGVGSPLKMAPFIGSLSAHELHIKKISFIDTNNFVM
jgi:hypothetical protein